MNAQTNMVFAQPEGHDYARTVLQQDRLSLIALESLVREEWVTYHSLEGLHGIRVMLSNPESKRFAVG
jgi:hypothetical protein